MSLGRSSSNPIHIDIPGPGAENFDTDCPLCLEPLVSGPVWGNPNPNCCGIKIHQRCINQFVDSLPRKNQSHSNSLKPLCPLCRVQIWTDHQCTPLPCEVWDDSAQIKSDLRRSQRSKKFQSAGYEREVVGYQLSRSGTRVPLYRDPSEVSAEEYYRYLGTLPETDPDRELFAPEVARILAEDSQSTAPLDRHFTLRAIAARTGVGNSVITLIRELVNQFPDLDTPVVNSIRAEFAEDIDLYWEGPFGSEG